jgi:hypothetical protein
MSEFFCAQVAPFNFFRLKLVCFQMCCLFNDVDDLRSTAIKAGVAAGVTVLLISVCIFAECVSRYRVWKRVKKATAATATQCETPILTKEEEAQIDEPKKI